MNRMHLGRALAVATTVIVATSCAAVAPMTRSIGEQVGPQLAAIGQAGIDAAAAGRASAEGSGCGPADGFTVNEQHLAFEETTGRPSFPIGTFADSDLAEARKAGFTFPMPAKDQLVLRRVSVEPGMAAYYLGGDKIGEETTLYDFLIGGGTVIFESGDRGTVASFRSLIGKERLTDVMIGDHDAVILRADELQQGLHAYVLAFEDHGHSIEIRAGYDEPGRLVDLARSLVCG